MKLISTLIFTMLLISCAAPKVAIYNIQPPPVKAMADVKTIAIVSDADDERHSDVLSKLEASLSSVVFDHKAHFNLVDRGMIDRIIEEQKLSNSDLSSSATRAKLGRLVGADTVISARSIVSYPESQSFYESRSKCVDKKCKESKKIKVRCSKREANVQLIPKIINVEKGNILYSKTYTSKQVSKTCMDQDSTEHTSNFDLMNSGIDDTLTQFKLDIAPRRVRTNVSLMEASDDKLLSESHVKLLETANEFAEKGNMSKACQIFAKVQSQNSSSIVTNYNNGVCAENNGDLETAIAFYTNAENNSIDVDLVTKATNSIKRVKEAQRAQEEMKKYRN